MSEGIADLGRLYHLPRRLGSGALRWSERPARVGHHFDLDLGPGQRPQPGDGSIGHRRFELIHGQRRDGIALIYISRRMAENYALAERVSVLREGSYLGSLKRAHLSPEKLVQMMVAVHWMNCSKRSAGTGMDRWCWRLKI